MRTITHAESQRLYKLSPKGREAQSRYYNSEAKREESRRWRARNQDKLKAHRKLNQAILNGSMLRGSCEICGQPNAMGHHDDYTKPLEVRWFCNYHHSELHRNEI